MKTIKDMKIRHNTGLFLSLLVALLVSCGENIMETGKDETPLDLTVNSDSLVLDVFNPDVTVLDILWTTGTNYGTNAAIGYQLQITVSGQDFEDGVTLGMGKNVTQMSYTNEACNRLLIDSLGIEPDTETDIDFRVIAQVFAAGIDAQVTDPVTVKIKSYTPVAKTLYMLGSATDYGWDADKATKMNSVSGVAGGFTWQGHLNAGELKFITTSGSFLPSYNRGATDTQLVYRKSDADPDDKFMIPAGGIYRISLNVLTLAIGIEQLEAPEYGELWFVGGFTGWNFASMRVDLLDPYVFYYHAELQSSGVKDEFKIATAADFESSTVFLRPEVNGQGAGTGLTVVKWSEDENGEDHKWSIEPGVYKIKLNQRDMKIDIVPFTPFDMIYLVGDASPNGWDIANATAMEVVAGDPYKFSWTGTLKAGEIKFSCDRKSDWNGAFFLATSNGLEPGGNEEQMLYSNPGSNPDNKWKISESGAYTIELDQLQQLVKFTKH